MGNILAVAVEFNAEAVAAFPPIDNPDAVPVNPVPAPVNCVDADIVVPNILFGVVNPNTVGTLNAEVIALFLLVTSVDIAVDNAVVDAAPILVNTSALANACSAVPDGFTPTIKLLYPLRAGIFANDAPIEEYSDLITLEDIADPVAGFPDA